MHVTNENLYHSTNQLGPTNRTIILVLTTTPSSSYSSLHSPRNVLNPRILIGAITDPLVINDLSLTPFSFVFLLRVC